ncbi:DUF2382 domain-containing protein [Herbiconiux sp. SYSU D00978]|uniref:DUF2382 domain-containing protein n=1 Tax=Herbiconiux sp. SYSU D00978 TaxID=2812562 RepID=UPI001A964732|nr:PRC and DUF2382 domain-containing protein [Herbiconiux sp. SYSU D00978]
MISTNNIEQLFDAKVVGSDDDRIGTVGQIFVDEQDGHPTWATVRTGLFGTKETFVPLDSATYTDDALHVAFTKDFVKDAPRIDTDSALTPQEEDELYSYYNLGSNAGLTDSGTADTFAGTDTSDRDADLGTTTGTAGTFTGTDTTASDYGTTETAGAGVGGFDNERTGVDSDRTAAGFGDTGHDTSGPNTDSAMTRSEEQLHVGTERVQTGRARLRKYVVTEQQTVTVPVEREEVRLEREPITDANAGAAYDGPAISEEEHEVTLSEERPVVEKEAVPVERVRLDKDVVTDQQQVSEDVRREEIELDGDTNGDRRL